MNNPLNPPLIIAHRGASSKAPENTFAAFEKALATGADGLEFDVQLSSDGTPVVIHDENLDRTTSGSGAVKNKALPELKNLDAGSWFAETFIGETIPTLEEILSCYRECRLFFNIELKNNNTAYPGLEEAVLEQVKKFNLLNRVIISSFNHDSLAYCHRLNPAVRTGLLYLEAIKDPWQYARSLGCYSVHPLFVYLQDPTILEGFKSYSLPLYPWTVNDPEQVQSLSNAGVEGIITDYPQELKAELKHMRR